MLDSSHPDVLARHGAYMYEDYFYTDGMCRPPVGPGGPIVY